MTSTSTIEACRSCSAPVIWCTTKLGKSMPVDLDPTAGGNLSVERRGGRTPLVHVVANHLTLGRDDLHTSHFVTCPQAKTWRRR